MSYALFTYGTLEDSQKLCALIGHALTGNRACLPGYRCARVKGAPYPGIIPSGNLETMGTLYHGLSLRMLKRLDRYEGNQYRRVLVSVYCHDGRWREAFVYRLKDPGQLSEQAWRPVGGTVRGGDE